MSYLQIGFEFKEIKVDFKANKDSSIPCSYEEAAGTSSEAPTTIEFPTLSMVFPELAIFIRPLELHKISVADIPVKASASGVTSHDALLNKSPNLLYNFFLYHNTAPKLFVDIKGYHTESAVKSYIATDSYGENILEEIWTDEEVVDFKMSFDASEYIYPAGVLHLTNPKTRFKDYCVIRGIDEYFERYTQSKVKLKDMELEKVIKWEFEELTRVILYSIRSQGYQGKVDISYRRENYNVKVISESKVAKLYHSKIITTLCVLTCCCLIFAPFARAYDDYLCVKMRYTFKMSISIQEWYNKNISSILREVRNRYGCDQKLIGSVHGGSSNYYSSI